MSAGFHVVIPARFASTRLPGKPLRLLLGKPLLQHVLERARESRAERVLIATDDARIIEAARAWGAEVVSTSPAHPNGTSRLAEVVEQLGWDDAQTVVNLQGDEPQLPGEMIDQVAAALIERPDAQLATLAAPIHEPAELFNPNVVKVVLRADASASYFSRAPIPWVRDAFVAGLPALLQEGLPALLPEGVPFLRHIGLYAYRAGTLRELARAPVDPIEAAESLEQLRALALGMRIVVGLRAGMPGHGVDTESDLHAVESVMRQSADSSATRQHAGS
jgi:3-deoxy-manno-octulosonate cytidylyltransferase (CMP-KDO synthetase)